MTPSPANDPHILRVGEAITVSPAYLAQAFMAAERANLTVLVGDEGSNHEPVWRELLHIYGPDEAEGVGGDPGDHVLSLPGSCPAYASWDQVTMVVVRKSRPGGNQ